MSYKMPNQYSSKLSKWLKKKMAQNKEGLRNCHIVDSGGMMTKCMDWILEQEKDVGGKLLKFE